jgi:hypothetical protein
VEDLFINSEIKKIIFQGNNYLWLWSKTLENLILLEFSVIGDLKILITFELKGRQISYL